MSRMSEEERAKLEKEIEEIRENLKRLQGEIHGPNAPDAPMTPKERELGEKLRQLMMKLHGFE